MCMGGKPQSTPTVSPMSVPLPPPPPAPTAQGMTVGSDRRSAPLQQFLQNTISANRKRGTTALRTDLGSMSGLNVPLAE